MINKNKVAVETEYDNESRLLEILHNFDKIIYRGQTEYESNMFKEKSNDAFEKALDFQTTLEGYGLFINIILSILVAIIIWRIVVAFYSKEVSATYFITTMTMLILYRDKMSRVIQDVPDCVEFVGRTNTVLKHFKDISVDNVESDFDKIDLVIMDEVHFINDPDRGKIWEETIIMLSQSVQLIMLSATINNVEHFAKWISSIREKKLSLVKSNKRIVPLSYYMYTENHLHKISDSTDSFNDKIFLNIA
jgi:hypothetical protein